MKSGVFLFIITSLPSRSVKTSYKLIIDRNLYGQIRDARNMPDFEMNEKVEFEHQEAQRTEEPPKYRVLLVNDNYTTFDFVIEILVSIFNKSVADAVSITTDVHKKGSGVCGVYSREIAETKLEMVTQAGKEAGFPLRCVMEAE